MRVDRFDWRFSVTSDASVNAFAYPGGRIFVTRGLLDMATDDEVVAVLGHEVGAAPALAELRLVQQRLGQLLLTTLLSSNGDGDGRCEGFRREIGGQLLGYANPLGALSYSRSNEYEADFVGWHAGVRTPWVARKDGLQTIILPQARRRQPRHRLALDAPWLAREDFDPRRDGQGARIARARSPGPRWYRAWRRHHASRFVGRPAQLAPPIKYRSSGSEGGGGVVSGVASAAGSVWSLLPRELQAMALSEGAS